MDPTDENSRHRKDVHEIVASHRAFAARRGNGAVVTWGDPLLGGDCSMVPLAEAKGLGLGELEAWRMGVPSHLG